MQPRAAGRPSRSHTNTAPCVLPRAGFAHSKTGSFLSSSGRFWSDSTAIEYPSASRT